MSLITQLKTIPDPRAQRGKRYPLWLLMFLALLGSLCGYWGYRPLAKFCSKHQHSLAQLLELDSQSSLLPSYSTFRRLFLLVDAQAWVDAFNVWAISHAPEWTELNWAIDGKSIRCTSSGGQTSAQDFACLVSVYGQRSGVVQLALMFNRSESEIAVAKRLVQSVTAAPTLAQSLPLGFSLDALHLQVGTLELLESRHCSYVIALKANQKQLYQRAQRLVQQQTPLTQASHRETQHGRQTQRSLGVYPFYGNLPQRWAQAGLSRLLWVQRRGTRSGQAFEEDHFYLSNAQHEARVFLEWIRSHWSIENGLHWVKDVTFKEDDPPRRGGQAPLSWAVVHSFLITLARRLGMRTVPDCQRDLANQVHEVFSWLT